MTTIEYQGTAAIVTATFTVAGVATDPSSVTFRWQCSEGGVEQTAKYGTGIAVTRVSTGVYQVTITTRTGPGTHWTGQVEGTGACAVTEPFTFDRARPTFPL